MSEERRLITNLSFFIGDDHSWNIAGRAGSYGLRNEGKKTEISPRYI